MIDSKKLKGRIVEKDTTIQKLAPKTGYSAYTLGQMIANKVKMPLEVCCILKEELDINNDELVSFFYNKSC